MGTNAAFPPYEYYDDETGEIVGIDAEIADLICKKLGYDGVEIVDMDFSAIINAVVSGKVDFGMAGMTVTEERLQSVDFTTSYATGIQSVIVPEGSDITSVDDLFAEGANHKVGVQLGTTGDIYCSGDIEEAGLGTIERYNNGADAVVALVSGKIDCVVIDNQPAQKFVAANEGLKILETAYTEEDYAICLNKDSELTAQINEALEALIADGTVQSVIDKYITAE
ncbi:MAG: transporter substrate-binding domain-containing protein [Clostridiales bacterium]|nr:transporter substrate-binding domain-containing protein [Clostridiales bacterium]